MKFFELNMSEEPFSPTGEDPEMIKNFFDGIRTVRKLHIAINAENDFESSQGSAFSVRSVSLDSLNEFLAESKEAQAESEETSVEDQANFVEHPIYIEKIHHCGVAGPFRPHNQAADFSRFDFEKNVWQEFAQSRIERQFKDSQLVENLLCITDVSLI